MTADGHQRERFVLDARSLVLRIGLFALPALAYLQALGGKMPFPPGEGQFSDLLITHYPNLLLLRNSLLEYHQLPLWNPVIFSGAPFAANPLSGLFYLPGWLAMLFPLPGGISLIAAAHAVFGAWGMYLFLRRLGRTEWGSIFGALGIGLMPKLAAHFGAGHISMLYAISWTPWLFWVSEGDRRGWLSGAAAGMLFLADPRWAAYAGILWLTYGVAYRQFHREKGWFYYLKAALIGFLIGAPLLIPLLEYLPWSTRINLDAGDILALGLPARQLLGLVIPGSGGNTEWYLYPGAAVLLLSISQLLIPRLRKMNLFWNIWIVVSLFLSLGLWGGSAKWLEIIPGISLLRVPARNLFLAGYCLTVTASASADYFVKAEAKHRRIRLLGFAGMVTAVIFSLGILLVDGATDFQAYWGFAFIFAVSAVLFVYQKFRMNWAPVSILLAVLLIDQIGAAWMSYQVKSSSARVEPEILEILKSEQEDFRVYSPSYSLAQHEAVLNDLRMADGVDPLQISLYALYMEEASGVQNSGYSVTIPGFRSGSPDTDNIQAHPDAQLLGKLSVKYLVAEYPINADGLTLILEEGGQYLYQNLYHLPLARVESAHSGKTDDDSKLVASASIIKKTPNWITLQADGPGKLVLSEIYYPGWDAFLDGERTEIDLENGLFRSLELPAGRHSIRFVYNPLSVFIGLALSAVGVLMVIIELLRTRCERISR